MVRPVLADGHRCKRLSVDEIDLERAIWDVRGQYPCGRDETRIRAAIGIGPVAEACAVEQVLLGAAAGGRVGHERYLNASRGGRIEREVYCDDVARRNVAEQCARRRCLARMLNGEPVALQNLVRRVGRIVQVWLVRAGGRSWRGVQMTRRGLNLDHAHGEQRNPRPQKCHRTRLTQQAFRSEPHHIASSPSVDAVKPSVRLGRDHMLSDWTRELNFGPTIRRRVNRSVSDRTAHDESAWTDHDVSREIATQAGLLLVELRRSVLQRTDQSWLRDQGDARSHRLIMDRLAELRPDDAILSEEGKDDRGRLERSRVWVVDPLDGTREFGEPPRDDWAVHVALCVDGEPVAGTVALPAQERVYTTEDPIPATRSVSEPLRMVASRTRAPKIVSDVATALGADLIFMGSAGAKAMAVVSGGADIYLHAGGQYEWDSAAPVAVAAAAGLHCSRIDGSRLVYNQPNPYMPDLLICRRNLASRILTLLRTHHDSVAGRDGSRRDG
jgi:3'(2'), 5'-bisphosphate nucleotidase